MKPQVDASTPILPTNFFALLSESIKLNPNLSPDPRMKGMQWKSDEILKGARTIEGELSFYGDPAVLGHLLNMAYAKGTTTGDAASGYTHPFTPGDGKAYTIDIVRGAYAQRLYGVRADSLKKTFQDNKMVVSVNVKALGQFNSVSLAVALTGAGMTTAVFSTEYDLRPTDGLVVGDVIIVGGVELTLLTVNANGTTVTFASTAVTASVGDPVYLKAQAVSLGTQLEPFYMGNTLVGLAATSALADTAAAARTTDTVYESITMTLKNNVIGQPGTASTGPSILLNGVQEAKVETSKLFETPQQYQKWIEAIKQAITVIATGRYIKTDLSTSEKLTVKFHKIKALTMDQPLSGDSYIFDKQNFEALYDAGDAKTVEIELVNRTIGTDY
jgi:hypothetical protein